MADYCSNTITIESKNREELEKIFELILGEDQNKDEIVFFSASYYDIAEVCEITDAECYRSFLISMELKKNSLEIVTESAWHPIIGLWLKIMNKYCTKGKFLYQSEECGNGIYETNIEKLCDSFEITLYPEDEDEEPYCFEKVLTSEKAEEYIDKYYQTEGNTIYEKLEELEEKGLCEYISWTYVPAEEQD